MFVCVCIFQHSVVVLVVVFALLDAVTVFLLLVLLLCVRNIPLWVVVQHGLGLMDLQLEKHKAKTFKVLEIGLGNNNQSCFQNVNNKTKFDFIPDQTFKTWSLVLELLNLNTLAGISTWFR